MTILTRLIVPLLAFLFGSFILIGAQLFVRPRLASFEDLPDQTEQRFLAKLKTGEFCGGSVSRLRNNSDLREFLFSPA
jgi:hypothetical protein